MSADLSDAEREMMLERARPFVAGLPTGGPVNRVAGSERETFEAGWIAARAYYAKEYDEATQELAGELADARREASEAEEPTSSEWLQ